MGRKRRWLWRRPPDCRFAGAVVALAIVHEFYPAMAGVRACLDA
jgi:hypothetical protein